MNKNTNSRDRLSIERLLVFEDFFPDEQPLEYDHYLKGGSKEVILNVAAAFLGHKSQNSKFDTPFSLVRMLFNTENEMFGNFVYTKIIELEKKVKTKLINEYSSLKLFETFFSKPEEPETQTRSEFEINLFKAYLILNKKFESIQKKAFETTDHLEGSYKLAMMLFCMHYPLSDKTNYSIHEIWATQIIKAIYLFRFLETDTRTSILLDTFLADFKCETWQGYLKKIIALTLPIAKNENEAHIDIIVSPDRDFKENCTFIEKLVINKEDRLDPNDFLAIRARPFYKVKEGVFRIIFGLFVVEKIFKGIYFLLRDVNNILSEEFRIKELRSIYGNDFSEKILCYNVIESIYPGKCVKYSGDTLTKMQIDAAPDYYIRKGKNILLVESKDFLITAEKKFSFDFDIYRDEFSRVLDFEELPKGKIKSKAVTQLISNVRRILRKEFPADKEYHYREIFIYPILLTHDHQYDTPGFNELVNDWFQEALEDLKDEGLFINRVKPITVVNIDSLIYNQQPLAEDIPLTDILDLYQRNKDIHKIKRIPKSEDEYDSLMESYKQEMLTKLSPFSLFINNYLEKRELKRPPLILQKLVPSLFNTQNQPDNPNLY